jgi:chitin disaccharide deacetylase
MGAATTASQLGFGPEAKLLMVHADDAGMCHSANIATQEAMLGGLVSSASIMVPCPWFPEMADWAKQNANQDLGVHLTLTSEWKYLRWRPVAPVAQVKGLLDPDGFLWRDVRSAAAHATAAEVETELRAQIERARQFGVKFTHLDTHMGTLYARADYFDVYARLGREYKVPCMLPRPTAEAAAELKAYPVTADMLTALEKQGHVLLDRLVTGVKGRTVEERQVSYREFLAALKPGVTKLIIHLAKDDAEIRAVTGNWQTRWADYVFFTSAEARELLAQHKIKLTTYRELGRLLRV